MSTPIVVYIAIGNSDDKLPQSDWANFTADLHNRIRQHVRTVHGEWYSEPSSRWQNMVVCAEVYPRFMPRLRDELAQLAYDYQQDSIALSTVERVDLVPSRDVVHDADSSPAGDANASSSPSPTSSDQAKGPSGASR